MRLRRPEGIRGILIEAIVLVSVSSIVAWEVGRAIVKRAL